MTSIKRKTIDFSPKGELVEYPKIVIKNKSLNDKLLDATEMIFKKLLETELKYNDYTDEQIKYQ